tara:strand:+ start:1371 stop:1694 length:324 start_codon:yes stop_codon:yes gene_type:complete
MAHADNATKAWVSAIPVKNSDGNVTEWRCQYKYTLAVESKDDYVHTFNKVVRIDTPSKAPASYTKAELLTLMDKNHLDIMFNRKYTIHTSVQPTTTVDASFDVSGLD